VANLILLLSATLLMCAFIQVKSDFGMNNAAKLTKATLTSYLMFYMMCFRCFFGGYYGTICVEFAGTIERRSDTFG
jgi:hypothetical protein